MTHTVEAGVIQAARLDLIPLSMSLAAAIVAGERPPGARWALGYPTDGTLVGAGLVLTAHNAGEPLGAFGAYQVVQRDQAIVVGDCGFDGPPDDCGRVHAVFGTAPSQRGRGYSREALQALIRWARSQPGVQVVTADTARTNLSSIRVMEGAGMRRASRDEALVYYEA